MFRVKLQWKEWCGGSAGPVSVKQITNEGMKRKSSNKKQKKKPINKETQSSSVAKIKAFIQSHFESDFKNSVSNTEMTEK